MKRMRFSRSYKSMLLMMALFVFAIGIALKIALFSQTSDVLEDRRLKLSNRQPARKWPYLPVHVVEEHHEVLPYWLREAERGRIPKDVTLIHIDGHSDLATNFYLKGYPMFEWPLDGQDVNFMMQRNDGFITAAAMAGFIKHVVWIWPTWDQINHNASNSSGTIQLGWTIVQQSSLGSEKQFCMCITDETDYRCMFFTDDDVNPEVEMENDLCFVKRSIGFTDIREDLAVEYLDSIDKNVDIILDIDEDFFGCEYASQPLFDHSIPNIETLDNLLNRLFCPLNPAAEMVLDKFLTDLIEYIKSINCGLEIRHKKCRNNFSNKIKQFYLRKSSSWRSHLCSDAVKYTTPLFDDIIKEFSILDKSQLHAIQTVGFCLSTTHKTYQMLNPSLFGMCRGANSPNQTVVTEHRTNRKEVHTRGKLVNRILQVFRASPPKFVTVCRSIRDGYTPRKYFRDIEYLILRAIRSNYPDSRVFYDDGLLNGKTGFRQRLAKMKLQIKDVHEPSA